MMALRLNEPKLITEVLECIPSKDSECLNLKFLNLLIDMIQFNY